MARVKVARHAPEVGASQVLKERNNPGAPVLADAEIQMSTFVQVGTLRNAAIDVARTAAETARTASAIADALGSVQQRLVDATARLERAPRRSAA